MIDIHSISPGSVNVFIGPNGSGKSRLLRRLCSKFVRDGNHVIGIAPSIYDRFRRIPRRYFDFYGARQGRAAAARVVQSALARASYDNPQILKNLTTALRYTKFDPVVGIRISKINLNNLTRASTRLPREEILRLESALQRVQNLVGIKKTIPLTLDNFSFQEMHNLDFSVLARHDKFLRQSKTTSKIEYLLYRKGKQVPLLEACSGEICFITTVAFISLNIKPGSVIAIDEPETSLHPTWQQSYVRSMLDLFSYYEPRILISTHSPIIISGAEASKNNTRLNVYELQDGDTRLFEYANLSLEEMYDRLFDLITPKNHYLSQRAVSLLNALNSEEQDLNSVLSDLEGLRSKAYDDSQRKVILKFEEMAKSLDAKRREAP